MLFSYSVPGLVRWLRVPRLAGVAWPRLPNVDPLRIGALGTGRMRLIDDAYRAAGLLPRGV